MIRPHHFLPLLLLASPATAAPDWSIAPRQNVTLSNFKFAPNDIHLRAGQPVQLHLVNAAQGGHDFTAPEFFAAATLRPEDRALVDAGSVELRAGESRDIMLVPAAGRYKLKCTHMFHKMFGMKGSIVVD